MVVITGVGIVNDSIDFLVRNNLIDREHDIKRLDAFKAKINTLPQLGLYEQEELTPNSESLEDITKRMSRIDPSTTQETASHYLEMEESIRRAVHILRKVGYDRDNALSDELLRKAGDFTEKLVSFFETLYLLQDRDMKWNSESVINNFRLENSSYREMQISIDHKLNFFKEKHSLPRDYFPGKPSEVSDENLEAYKSNLRLIIDFMNNRLLYTESNDAEERESYAIRDIGIRFKSKYDSREFPDVPEIKLGESSDIYATSEEIRLQATALSEAGYITEPTKNMLVRKAELFSDSVDAYFGLLEREFDDADKLKNSFNEIVNAYPLHSQRILFVEGLTNNLEKENPYDRDGIDVYITSIKETQKRNQSLQSLKMFRGN